MVGDESMVVEVDQLAPVYALLPGCDLHKVRESGRHAVRENDEPLFKRRFVQAFSGTNRDYRDLLEKFFEAARVRGYILRRQPDTYKVFSELLEKIVLPNNLPISSNARVELYCDVFVAAILACPITDENIYE